MLTVTPDKPDTKTAAPLVVDLDGTLIRSDVLVESIFSALASDPWHAVALLKAARAGKASLKECAARLSQIDVASLPYDQRILDLIAQAREDGRKVFLASASHESLVAAIAKHLGVFDGYFASSGTLNLKAEAKAERLVTEFGKGGFDYIGNDVADLPVWNQARQAIAVRASPGVEAELLSRKSDAKIVPNDAGHWRAWLKLLRVHQYAKNMLVFVPLIAAHAFSGGDIAHALLAFAAFCLCASGIYILNDLIDLSADRAHPTKRNRPLANGTVPIIQALIAAPSLVIAAFVLAAMTTWLFVAILAVYVALTTAYSLHLKRKLLVDAVALAGLYTLRVVGGAAAIPVPVSRWLLVFSLFIFTALALVKRYVELARLLDRNLPNPKNRAYEKGDLPIVASLAAAAGYNAVIVLALYVSSDAVSNLYRRPELLWLTCPIVMYWVSRLIIKAHRRQMDDDPVVYALKDRISLGAAAAIAILGMLAL